MTIYYFVLDLSPLECENLYSPGVNSVLIQAENGVKVRLPTLNLRPFVSRYGLKGRFRMVINNKNKIESFEKIS